MLKFFLCLGLCCCVTQAQSADTLAQIKERKAIVIAHRETSVPLSYLSEEGKPVGYAMEICNHVLERIKRDLKLPQLAVSYLLVNSSNRFTAMVDGKADMECGVTANTTERRNQVAFSIPYFFGQTRMLVPNDSTIRKWNDLAERTVVIVRGSTTNAQLRQHIQAKYSKLRIVEAATPNIAIDMLEAKKADVVVWEELALAGLRANSKSPETWRIVGDPIGIEAQAIMLPKDDVALKSLVDKEIAKLISDDELSKIYEKWFQQALPQSGLNYRLPMSFLLHDSLGFPSGAAQR